MTERRRLPQEQRERLAGLRAAMLDEEPATNGYAEDPPFVNPPVAASVEPRPAPLEELIEARLRELLSISLRVGASDEQGLSDKALSTLVTALKVAQGFVEWRKPGGGTGPGSKLKEGGDGDV